MSKALKSKTGQYFTLLLASMVVVISSICWSRLIQDSYQNEVTVVESISTNPKPTASNIRGKYMIITGVMTAIVKYLPFQSNDN